MKVEYTIIVHPEDFHLQGDVCACGDPNCTVEQTILQRLEDGDEWAWCTVELRASFGDVSASVWLGGCSYQDEEDFKTGGYYEDMCTEAKEALDEQVANLKQLLAEYS